MDNLSILKEIVLDDNNTIVLNKDTLFETSYPRIIIDCLSLDNIYIDFKSLDSFENVKILKIKNQETDKFVAVNPKDLLKVFKNEGKITISYKKDDKKHQMTI